jgi:hypothetical protein
MWGVDDAHRLAVERFWRLWFQEHGAVLDRFTSDPQAAFSIGTEQKQRIEPRPGPVGMMDSGFRDTPEGAVQASWRMTQQMPSSTASLEREPEASASKVSNESSADQDKEERAANITAPETTPAAPEPTASLGNDYDNLFDLAISWTSSDPHCDLDLHVVAKDGEALSSDHASTSFGRHHGDIRRGGSCGLCQSRQGGWEIVTVRIDRMEDLVVWVNVYETTAPAEVVAELRYAGKHRSKKFRIDLRQGDGGGKQGSRYEGEAWVKLHLPDAPDWAAARSSVVDGRSILNRHTNGARDAKLAARE